MKLELGADTFGDVMAGPDGASLPHAQVIRNVIAQGVAAEAFGLDFFGVGEHHRADFAVSSPEMVLAAIAGQTTRIKLGSAVTVLSSDDPVRVYQRFSTLDAASNGRAEVVLGRGSFTESFPLFGFDLNNYEVLFEEKLALYVAVLRNERANWRGTIRPPVVNQQVFPRPESGTLSTWIGVGGSPQSVIRAANYDLPLMLAVIGGDPARFKPFVELHHRAYAQLGRRPQPIGVHSPGYVAETDEAAKAEFYAPYKAMRDHIGAQRGWPPMQRAEFDSEVAAGSLYLGSPETVAQKIAATVRLLGAQRFDLKYSAGTLPHDKLMRCLDLYGTKVIPRVRELLA